MSTQNIIILVKFRLIKIYGVFYFLLQKYILKKYFYGINHKRLGLHYFYFSLVTGLSGATLATAIRFEMASPGSLFFGGDSLRYLQVITAHALIMIFFVVVPIFFGGFANFLLPYHIGSKDVAFPRLNSLGFWIQPCGYILIAKIGFIRTEFWFAQDKIINYLNLQNASHYRDLYEYYLDIALPRAFPLQYDYNVMTQAGDLIKTIPLLMFKLKQYIQTAYLDWITTQNYVSSATSTRLKLLRGQNEAFTDGFGSPWKVLFWKFCYDYPETFWYLTQGAQDLKRRKRYIVKCSNAGQTVAGWTFITPFSSKLRFTGVGIQDMLILGVYFAGISTTISLVNLLVTKRSLTMSGLRSRRILIPFISTTILLMLRALAVITPVLGSAMLMLALDRHWFTSFFDFAYGGDPVFFHHLFWFFGHPEVYVLVIPAFGVINSILPSSSLRRIASKHHLIWAIYIMNYMGFLVWGHHMYLIGLDHRSRALYSTITIMISMPATIKVVNWTFTLVNGFLKKDTNLIAILSFIFFFLVAGFTGMWLSHVSLNISMHDTLYVVAHFHLMLSGAVIMSIFAGFYFYYYTFFSLKYSRNLSYTHLSYYTGGQWMTFLPLFWVSFSGLPRRLHDYPAVFAGWQSMATVGHLVTMFGVTAFYALLIESALEKKITVIITTVIAKLNHRVLYYLFKFIWLHLVQKLTAFLPKKKIRSDLTEHRRIHMGF